MGESEDLKASFFPLFSFLAVRRRSGGGRWVLILRSPVACREEMFAGRENSGKKGFICFSK